LLEKLPKGYNAEIAAPRRSQHDRHCLDSFAEVWVFI